MNADDKIRIYEAALERIIHLDQVRKYVIVNDCGMNTNEVRYMDGPAAQVARRAIDQAYPGRG